jgi:hypothetical protein
MRNALLTLVGALPQPPGTASRYQTW